VPHWMAACGRGRAYWRQCLRKKRRTLLRRLVWSGELLQAVQEVFEKERETLNAKLQSRPGDSDLGPYCSLLERPEKVIQEQGDLQEKAQEHLHLPARRSLLRSRPCVPSCAGLTCRTRRSCSSCAQR
jgi:hypothetical protein